MTPITRRSFVSHAAATVATFGALSQAAPEAQGQLVWKSSQWNIADFRKLIGDPARIKQIYDVVGIGNGKFLNNIKNSLNGLSFGFGIPEQQMKVAAGLHGPANMVNYDDYIWEKYRVGEWLSVTDPTTGKPAVRNIFYPEKTAASQDPNDEHSPDQDTSVQRLQARGVQFLSCHTALEEQARALVRRDKLTQTPEAIVRDMLAHALPGVLVVASMVAAIALLQAEGHYTYITA